MRKNKIGDILFGLLLLGFILSNLTGCGQAKQPPYAVSRHTGTVAARKTDESSAVQERNELPVSQETDEPSAEQEQVVDTGPENCDIAELPGEIIVENESDMEDSESETETNADNDARMPDADFVVDSSAKAIAKICGLTAPVEEDVSLCYWDSYGKHPYDVVYDYGKDYKAYVKACDWSLVFDAEYYAEQFPMLALQYHYDKKELLFHFQTVGVHEGRQGCKEFNVSAYMMNGDSKIKNIFHCNPEGYYIYYMLNYDTEKDINTVYREDGKPAKIMYYYRPTALQKRECDAVNEDRKKIGNDTLTMKSETCALASYRAYINAHDGYEAHDWALDNMDLMRKYNKIIGGNRFAENTVTWFHKTSYARIGEPYYRASKSHYDAMVAEKYAYIGASNICNGKTSSSQFDFFTNNVK